MVMDQKFNNYSGSMSEIDFTKIQIPIYPDPDLIQNLRVTDGFSNGNHHNFAPAISSNANFVHYAHNLETQGESPEDLDFSDEVLRYINHILLEEDVEDKACMFQESAALQAAEKSFHDVLMQQQYPPSSDVPDLDPTLENPDDKFSEEVVSYFGLGDPRMLNGPNLGFDPIPDNKFNGHASYKTVAQSTSRSSYSSSSTSSSGPIVDAPIDSPVSILKVPNIFSDSLSAIQFKKGVEEASKFLPNGSNLFVDLSYDEPLGKNFKQKSVNPVVKVEKKLDKHEPPQELSRGKKHPYLETLQEGRMSKQSAVYSESTVSPDMFDKVLLCSKGKNESEIRKELSEVSKTVAENGDTKGSVKTSGKKKGGKRNVVDMRTLLSLCAQAVAADDRRTANEFLKQIRQHASPTGDGMQRLGHYFAGGLEARMAGSATQIYKSLINMPTSAADILKAYHIYLATCPFRKISNFFANKSIMNVAENAQALHIVDFGILYGFQWPVFLQHLSARHGGPPRLRITGIDLPCPGFKPSERVEETGRRLARYAEKFRVPFEFNAIAQKWDTVKLEDLKIKKDEMLVVNCLFRFKNLLDETVVVNSPRNAVLGLIKKMNPTVFILGITNGAYNAPFFITRFREALFHYSSMFDMLDANIPREVHERMLLEKTIFGREAMNVIACEAAERIERPETYKQWQVRNIRAGFEQLPINEEIMERAKSRVRMSYHKDFVIDKDGHWLLQGWKGRIIYALSSWRPSH